MLITTLGNWCGNTNFIELENLSSRFEDKKKESCEGDEESKRCILLLNPINSATSPQISQIYQ
jgi:hypothetical protein